MDEDETVDQAGVIKHSLRQCRSLVSDYRSVIAANTNLPNAASEPNDGAADPPAPGLPEV